MHLQSRWSTVSWVASKEGWQQGEGRDCPSLLVRFQLEYCLWALGPSTTRMWSCWTGSREDHENDQGDGAPLLLRQARRAGLFQLGEEQAPRRPRCGLKGSF